MTLIRAWPTAGPGGRLAVRTGRESRRNPSKTDCALAGPTDLPLQPPSRHSARRAGAAAAREPEPVPAEPEPVPAEPEPCPPRLEPRPQPYPEQVQELDAEHHSTRVEPAVPTPPPDARSRRPYPLPTCLRP